eukprot:11755780-Ditylum_brightwellii.AAC.1
MASLDFLIGSQLTVLVLLPTVLPQGTTDIKSMMKLNTWAMSGYSLHYLKASVTSSSHNRMPSSGYDTLRFQILIKYFGRA